MNHSDSWYVAVDEVTVGPAPTDLVIRGIEHRKIPPEALVCKVGAGRWDPLAKVDVFHAAVVRSYPPPPPDSEEARRWMAQGFRFPALAALPRFEYPLDDEAEEADTAEEAELVTMGETPKPPAQPVEEATPDTVEEPDPDWDDETVEPPLVATPEAPEPRAAARASGSDAVFLEDGELDVDWDEVAAASHLDWRDPFESFFLVGDEVELPEEQVLLESLATASRETFRDESALWNLALCLAYGSDEVGAAAARAFFEAMDGQSVSERLDWMNRTLLGNGFMPSGIPAEAGERGVRRLQSSCPPSLSRRLSS